MKLEFYKCEDCGNVYVKIFDGEKAQCCGSQMVKLEPGVTDAATEKHVPFVEEKDGVIHVQIGSVEHPMLDVHWITTICLETEKGFQCVKLNPGDKPIADFVLNPGDRAVAVYEYCNIHNLWVKELA